MPRFSLNTALDQEVLEMDSYHRARLAGLNQRMEAFEKLVRQRTKKARKGGGRQRISRKRS